MVEKHDAPDSEHAEDSVVLRPIVQDRALLRDCKVGRKRSRCFAPVMDCTRTGIKEYLPPSIPCAPAPIDVIAIHEQAFIEQADLIKGCLANHREAAHDDIDVECAVMRKVEHVLAGEKLDAVEACFPSGLQNKNYSIA